MICITSIAPTHCSNQQKIAVQSWIDLGFEVYSLNCKAEIGLIKDKYPEVKFIETNQTGEKIFGKPYVKINALVDFGISKKTEFMIINSDIIMNDQACVVNKYNYSLSDFRLKQGQYLTCGCDLSKMVTPANITFEKIIWHLATSPNNIVKFDKFPEFWREYISNITPDVFPKVKHTEVLNISKSNIVSELNKQAKKSFIYLIRYDFKNTFSDGVKQKWGIDAFIFNNKNAKLIPKTEYCQGQCWFDLWLPYIMIKSNVPTVNYDRPFLFHKLHTLQWTTEKWERMGEWFRNSVNIPASQCSGYNQLQQLSIEARNEIDLKTIIL